MARVHGSPQEKLVVVVHRPWRLFLTRITSVVVIVSLVVGAFLFGRSEGFEKGRFTTERVNSLTAEVLELERTILNLRQRTVILEKGAEVDRAAAESVRQTNRRLRDEIAAVEQEVRLYRGIMAPGDNSTGLLVEEFSAQRIGPDRYRFLLMLTHAGSDGTFLEGYVGVNIIGETENGDKVVYALQDVSPDIDRVDIRFRYRYFQDVRGEIQFPAGFRPTQVRIVAQAIGNRSATRDLEIDWQVIGEE
ncbi:hypothetical protein NFC81_01235 [Salinispirillum sp. LH 10-3-1]|uniref:Uncharacterized protein n=1 Tax=Salinispirillum sp. LH 10-3-1 TaxID=2952525 RepID=A0AB38YGK3_9GAMM